MKIKKKLRIINCTTCGVEIQTYNVHQKYCNACREAKKNEQKIKWQIRKAAKREEQRESEQPLDPGRENRVLGLIKKYEAIEATLLKHKIKPQSAEAYEVDMLININT
jgi:ribosomal protein L37E